MAYASNQPDFRITLGGNDLSPAIRPRLISLEIVDKRAGEADELTLTLDDTDGKLALPKPGAVLSVSLGWKRGSDVTVGLVDKGSFKVDEVEHTGPPDIVSIRARSADFTSDLKARREHSWHATTLGAVIRDIAARNKLTARVSPKLASIAVTSLTQSRESDMALVRRLGREHDAVATVKKGALIFAPVGSGATASGKALPAVTVRRSEVSRHSYTLEKSEDVSGVTATWHDRKGARKQKVTAGSATDAKVLSRVYMSEGAARTAASAEQSRLARNPTKLTLELALGRPDLYPEQRITAQGFKAEINGTSWLAVEVRHSLSGGGLTTAIALESAS